MRTLIVLVVCLFAGVVGAHHDADSPRPPVQSVEVVAMDGRVRLVDLVMLQAMPPVEVSRAPHEADAVVRWTGVPLADVLRASGAPLGEDLRGRGLAIAVRATASDGSQVVFSLAELDDQVGQASALLVYRGDGELLDDDGPFRLVLPNDVRPARWIRNLVKLELLDLRVDAAPSPGIRPGIQR